MDYGDDFDEQPVLDQQSVSQHITLRDYITREAFDLLASPRELPTLRHSSSLDSDLQPPSESLYYSGIPHAGCRSLALIV